MTVTMTSLDIHIIDVETRHRLADHLRRVREQRGLCRREVAARWGVTKGALGFLETSPHWLAPTLQRWARALDFRIVFELHNIPPADNDPGDAVLAAMAATTPTDEDAIHLARTHNRLAAARQQLQLSQAEIGRRWGTTADAVADWETGCDYIKVASLQRASRAMGGWLTFNLETVP